MLAMAESSVGPLKLRLSVSRCTPRPDERSSSQTEAVRRSATMIQGVLVALALAAGTPDAQDKLGQDLWRWRAETQPAGPDDIPRIGRPAGWTPDWSPASIARRRATLADLEKRFRALPVRTEIPAEVDRRLIGTALARVRWELELNPGWRQNPAFYVDQALASPHELLVIPPPFDSQRSRDLVRRLDAVPALVDQARENLDRMRAPFLRVALEQLRDVRPRLSRMAEALQILRLIADARLRQGERFRLRDVHDFLFANRYVPVSLLRWEYLGLRDEVDALERLR